MPPDQRRALIVAATTPLMLEHGAGVTTRQIAEAAGIAEGTIFRVFPDKDALIEAVVEFATDPAPVEAALAEIDLALPLEQRLLLAVEILRRRVADIFQLTAALGTAKMPGGGDARDKQRARSSVEALAAVIEPDRDLIRRDPVHAAHLLRGLTIASTHPALSGDEPVTSAEIVSLLLDGLRVRPTEDRC